MSEAKTKVTKLHWWKPLWMALVAIAIVLGVINYFLFHYPLSSVIGGMAITLLGNRRRILHPRQTFRDHE